MCVVIFVELIRMRRFTWVRRSTRARRFQTRLWIVPPATKFTTQILHTQTLDERYQANAPKTCSTHKFSEKFTTQMLYKNALHTNALRNVLHKCRISHTNGKFVTHNLWGLTWVRRSKSARRIRMRLRMVSPATKFTTQMHFTNGMQTNALRNLPHKCSTHKCSTKFATQILYTNALHTNALRNIPRKCSTQMFYTLLKT